MDDAEIALELEEERSRIARDLHDRVLQRLFATGILLEGALRKAVVDDVITAIRAAIIDLDETVTQIRSTIYSLKSPFGSLRHDLLHEIEIARNVYGISVDFSLSGPIDSMVATDMYEDILAVTTEMLSNCGKRRETSAIKYELSVNGNELSISLINPTWQELAIKFGDGLENLAARANKYGGSLNYEKLLQGSKLTWKIPL